MVMAMMKSAPHVSYAMKGKGSHLNFDPDLSLKSIASTLT